MGKLRIERPNNERLILAYKYAGYDVMKKDFSRDVARDMLKFKVGDLPLIPWEKSYNDKKEEESKIASVSRSINKHLSYNSCMSISGIWVCRYCNFFGCSADFLYERIDTPTHDQADISEYTGLSPAAIDRLHRIHTRKIRMTSDEYTEPHKTIDFLNEVIPDKESTLLYDCYMYCHAKNMIHMGGSNPAMVPLTDALSGSGITYNFPVHKLYRQAKLADVKSGLDNISK